MDLLVEMPALRSTDDIVRLRSLFTAQLYRRMGERRIDVVMTGPGADDRLIVAEARRQAVELVRT